MKHRSNPLKVAIVTLGCPKNEVDSLIMRSHLAERGFEISSPEDADVIIVNTCGFIREAKEEAIDTILEAIDTGKPVYVAGCLYQRYGRELVESLPEVAGWISLGDVRDVAGILSSVRSPGPLREPVLPLPEDFRFIRPASFAYVKISEGCDNRCNYCAIPSIRGRLRSRPLDSVLEECLMWLDKGVKELILISQDTTSYGRDLGLERGLLRLLEELDRLSGDFWIRILYMHPAGVTEELLDLIRASEKVVSYVEIPLQHVSESVLRAMGRRGGKEAVERVVQWVEERGLLLRTTFMVGHPGEGEKEFEELVNFINSIRPWRFSVFGYSPEEGTVSNLMEAPYEDVVGERLSVITELQDRIISENTEEWVGKRVKILADYHNYGRFFGMSPDIDGVVFVEDTEMKAGSFYEVRLEEAVGVDLVGSLA